MIAVVSLNPCLDKTMRLSRFDPDATNRVECLQTDLGGKGVNVARVLSRFTGHARLFGFDFDGDPVGAELAGLLPCQLIRLNAPLRVNLKIREDSGRTIEINERGAAVTAESLHILEETLLSRCVPGDWAVLSGSLPAGAPVDYYGRLCAMLKETGCHVAVDASGPALAQALSAGPDLIKPNAREFFDLTGARAEDRPNALSACRELHRQGVGMICLSLGPAGALLSRQEGAFFCPAADVPVRGVIGAGDSMLAGLLLALEKGMEMGEALRFASAVAGASIQLPGTRLCFPQDVPPILAGIPPVSRCS